MKSNIITPKYKNGIFLRQNKSFISRKGRITKSQLKSIHEYWSFFGINYQLKYLNFKSVFKNDYPVILEIGFGIGDTLVQTAINSANKNFLGIEVYPPGIGSCLRFAYMANLSNLKIVYYNAVDVIENMISNHTLSKIQIFFPDPWPKKKHHKRRMIQDIFLKKILKKLIFNGILHIVTDSKEYADYILNTIKNIHCYLNMSLTDTYLESCSSHFSTKFEKKACILNKKIFNLMFQSKY
ncbi:tRNA (guanosine(46)-N7)-methyltransferase TrmB [Buchnera aphidicola (Aphis aurantii)]|uniref:tRNA (guanosine(46)-N7)-methyltransferase TrmB n=1 Tax=Buchnera aphidicola TaxID=9 RepID=UPI0031B66F53